MPAAEYGDFRDELFTKGFTVVPSVIDPVKATKYAGRALGWLEGFNLGFDRDDKETWRKEKLPTNNRGGLYNRNGIGHEAFVWEIRQEPGVIDAFAKIWGTNELLVSFDGANISVPMPSNSDDGTDRPWPHVDQTPLRTDLKCIQGIVNLHPNGPKDGGLRVLVGSTQYYAQFFEEHKHQAPEGGWSPRDSYPFKEEQLEWFYKKGCHWEKLCANPGDLILWDSRTIHYGAIPEGTSARIATYVCYLPASQIKPTKLAEKQQVFKEYINTSHDPVVFHQVPVRPDDRGFRREPAEKPEMTPLLSKLAGIEAY